MLPRSFQVKKSSCPFVHFLRLTMGAGTVMKYLFLVSCSFGIEITYCHLAVFLKVARRAEGLEVVRSIAAAEEYRDDVIKMEHSRSSSPLPLGSALTTGVLVACEDGIPN